MPTSIPPSVFGKVLHPNGFRMRERERAHFSHPPVFWFGSSCTALAEFDHTGTLATVILHYLVEGRLYGGIARHFLFQLFLEVSGWRFEQRRSRGLHLRLVVHNEHVPSVPQFLGSRVILTFMVRRVRRSSSCSESSANIILGTGRRYGKKHHTKVLVGEGEESTSRAMEKKGNHIPH